MSASGITISAVMEAASHLRDLGAGGPYVLFLPGDAFDELLQGADMRTFLGRDFPSFRAARGGQILGVHFVADAMPERPRPGWMFTGIGDAVLRARMPR